MSEFPSNRDKWYVNNNPVDRAYVGDELVYPLQTAPPPPPSLPIGADGIYKMAFQSTLSDTASQGGWMYAAKNTPQVKLSNFTYSMDRPSRYYLGEYWEQYLTLGCNLLFFHKSGSASGEGNWRYENLLEKKLTTYSNYPPDYNGATNTSNYYLTFEKRVLADGSTQEGTTTLDGPSPNAYLEVYYG